jgi:hypothetical protein
MEFTANTPETHQPNVLPEHKQNFPIALGAGIAAAIIGAIAWAIVTVTTEYQIGYMAIGVGFMVGFAVRLGHGRDNVFAVSGAVLALIGCLLGNFLSMVGFVAKQQNVNVFGALSAIDLAKVPGAMMSAFNPMDLLFYGIAVYAGFKFSVDRTAASTSTPPEAG